MRTTLPAVLALAATATAQSSTITPAPIVTGNPVGASYLATLPIKEGSPLRGSVQGSTGPDGVGVKFVVNFSGLPSSGGPFMYHLHEKPVPSDGNCSGTGAHLDPYKRGEVTLCDASRPETCQTGDNSGKFGNVTAQSWSQEYLDPYSSTRPGTPAFFGNLSFVLHLSNKTRIGCANFTLQSAGGYPSPSAGSAIPLPSPSGSYNGTATVKPTLSPTASKPAQFTGAAAKVVGGGAWVAGMLALVL